MSNIQIGYALHRIATKYIDSDYLPIAERFLTYIEQTLQLNTNGKPAGWALAIYAYILGLNHYHLAEDFDIHALASKLNVTPHTVKSRFNQINHAAGSIDAEPWLLPEVKELLDEIIDAHAPLDALQNSLPQQFMQQGAAHNDEFDNADDANIPEDVKRVMNSIRESLDELMENGEPSISDVVKLIEDLGGEVVQNKSLLDIPSHLPPTLKKSLAQGKSRGRGMLPPLLLQVMVPSNNANPSKRNKKHRPTNKYPIASQLIH